MIPTLSSTQRSRQQTLQIFQSALKSQTLKRFVLTSSSSARYTTSPKSKKPRTITAQDWNIDAVARAWASPPYTPDRFFDVYAASQTQSEHALWKALRECETDVVVNAVAPDSNFGPSLVSGHKSSTGKILYDAWKQSDGSMLRPFMDGGYRWLLDVRDSASLHVSALLDPDVQNERLLGYAHEYNGHQLS
ncbi:NAD-dependent epimerase/dehydratase terH [Fulvia fulva]|uniref:NAD-dependent epimerase/dehydratase terH n=1 Tax=Passalora fulva TaxID=5499 RepID=A0A9Q8UVY8_PASFU|nr:NAD-dependent epimerase/dehydratase terH [Fulvia fulva]KAK4610566.1 NAD-dependent epimerase/dehydratase terH [Fulvia fulva]KAK4611042.1 NAD-dependent epimerase/dehydratase terH [Fulvia fulva]UJO24489.1 NAD-dependent epimerase/dehydratase terH [Fulvia fulva]WPV22395.1 NAD-dependent epimerase/dehydratase terH [Fulvia fulva]WPV37217.1 NAD-dependent epimerase/dehydratase terH [Fulvia fulva]